VSNRQFGFDLQELARREGAALFGVADMARVRSDDFRLEPGTLSRFRSAIAVAVPVSATVLATITDHPNQLYFHHYRQLNNLLDRITLRLGMEIERLGRAALPIAASQIVDWQQQRAHLSHKRIAIAAGLGWLGRNNLLVTAQYGSRVRLATVLTDLALEPTLRASADSGCGECRDCIAVCPARAIGEGADEFNHQACYEQLKLFQKQGFVGQYICGICVRACGLRPRTESEGA
jgi:epoxyqueuosine reductase QueG